MWPAVLLLLLSSARARSRPNLVFIMADDMGYNDVGFHGGDVPTPNLDALAGHGVVLNRHYSEPACTPSRAALLTGRYPFRTGMQGSPLHAGIAKGLPLTEKIFPQYFRDLGYKTHLVGKWHLGFETWDHLPTRRGFDTFFGYLNGFVGYYDSTHTQTIECLMEKIRRMERNLTGQEFECTGVSGLDFRRGEVPAWEEVYGRYLTGVLTKEAVSLISGHPGDEGLLLLLSHMAPHTGNLAFLREAPPDVQANFTSRRVYAEMVRWLDDSVGEVVQALNRKGILNNTIIVFISDNGAPTLDVLWGYSNHGSNWPLRGEKISVHEGGVRTPALVWSPSLKHRISNDLFSITDWLPTLYSAAGGSVRDLGDIDGVDQLGSLFLETTGPRNSVVIGVDETQGIEAYIKGKWKLVKNFKPTSPRKFTDLYYGESGRNSSYNAEDVTRSLVGTILGLSPLHYLQVSKAFHQLYPAYCYDGLYMVFCYSAAEVNSSEAVREMASLEMTCSDEEASIAADCSSSHCLYDILGDPTECRNLAREFPLVVDQLSRELSQLKIPLTPIANRSFEPEAHPCLWNDYWTPWKGGDSTGGASSSSHLHPVWAALAVFVLLRSIISFHLLPTQFLNHTNAQR